MSVLKIVQSVNTLAVTGTAATTNGITLQSGILRVSAEVNHGDSHIGCHIEIGGAPVSTTNSFYLNPSQPEIIKERVARQRIGAATTGTNTLLTFQENVGNPFVVGDYVTIENTSAAGFNTSHNQVIAASDNSILINFNSASITGIGITNSTVARSVKISSVAAGASSNLYISEVQIVGG